MKLRSRHFGVFLLLTSACSGRIQLGDRNSSSGGSSSSSAGSPGSIGTASFCSNPTIDVLATQPWSTMEISLLGDTLYVHGGSPVDHNFHLVALPKGGGAVRTMADASTPIAFAVDGIDRIGADAELFYSVLLDWTFGADIPTNGTPPEFRLMYTGSGPLAVDRDFIYVASDYAVVRVPKDTHVGPGEKIATQEEAAAIRVDADSIYWVNGLGAGPPLSLRKLPKSGGPAITLATDDGVEGDAALRFAMDDEALYWGDRKNHKIAKYPKSGGDPLVLVQGADADWVLGLVADGGNAYWINGATGPRTLNRVSTSGGPVEHIATLEESAYGLAHDGKTFYYTTNSQPGAVKRVSCK